MALTELIMVTIKPEISVDCPMNHIPTMPRAAKVGHKKSRLGCQRCKTRRVKVSLSLPHEAFLIMQCDEQKPICGSCKRHGAECNYIDARPHTSPNDSSEGNTRRRSSRVIRKSPSPCAELFPRQLTEREDPDIPETKARRLMELRLQQNSLQHMSGNPNDDSRHNDDWIRLWKDMVPGMSLCHDNVLYSQFSLSATHLLRSHLDDEALYSARQNYFVLALREQRKACENIHPGNAEAVCLTSILILHTSFAMITERLIEPGYSPPIEWLKMGRGAGAVMWKANAAVMPESPATFNLFMDSYQYVPDIPSPSLEQTFSALYLAICDRELDPVLRDVYSKTLSYINSMQNLVENGERLYFVARRLQTFPMVVPSKFIDQVENLDVCALVILAHYFAVASQIDQGFWWLRGFHGDRTAVREVQAINVFLADTCPALMTWPLVKVGITI